MKVYRIKHKPSGLYYNGFDHDEDEKGKAFKSNMEAIFEFQIWVNMKAHGIELSDWEIEEYEIKD